MNGSGKEVLLRILLDLSTRVLREEDEFTTAERSLRGGLLMHGSTAEESVEHASRLTWSSECDEAGEVVRQGIALKNGSAFVSDLYETVFAAPRLKEFVLARHPDLNSDDFDSFEWVMWLLVSSVQMFSQLNPIERSGEVDVEKAVDVMMKAYEAHFRGLESRKQGE